MSEKESEEGVSFWEKRWVDQNIRFHIKDDVHPFLKDNHKRLTGKITTSKRVLVPLCGKTLDMKFLYDLGLTVIGIEVSEIAIKSYFSENSLTYQVEESCGFNVYKHDERLIIFQGDLFEITADIIGGTCDLHWDRGGLVAMEEFNQNKYVSRIKSLLSTKSTTLMECFEYDKSIRSGPPRCIPTEQLKELFGNKFNVDEINRVPTDNMPKCCNRLEGVTHVLYIIEQKNCENSQ